MALSAIAILLASALLQRRRDRAALLQAQDPMGAAYEPDEYLVEAADVERIVCSLMHCRYILSQPVQSVPHSVAKVL